MADLKPIFRRYWHHDLKALFLLFINQPTILGFLCQVKETAHFKWAVSHVLPRLQQWYLTTALTCPKATRGLLS